MKAIVYHGPENLVVEDVDRPRLGPGEVLVRPRAVSICGSDLSAYKKATPRRKPPLVMGHEVTGDIVELGPGVTGVRPGDRVAVQPLLSCDECVHCRRGRPNLCLAKKVLGIDFPGAYAEYFKVPKKLVHKIPKNLSYVHGALAEPLAVILHAVNQAGGGPFEDVLVMGAGMMGLLMLINLKTLRTGRIFIADLNDEKLQLAKLLGADVTINPARHDLPAAVAGATGGAGAGTVFEAVGVNQTLCQAMSCCKKGGRVVIIGTSQQQVQINMLDIVFNELELVGAYVSRDEFPQAIELLASGRLDLEPIINVKKTLFEAADAFRLLADETHLRIKAVLIND